MMEIFADFLSHADHQAGRLIEFLRQLGELDNTLIMVISDNGASAEGGPPGPRTRHSSSTTPRSRPRTASS
jgi:arylsulfatase A-like enzyme